MLSSIYCHGYDVILWFILFISFYAPPNHSSKYAVSEPSGFCGCARSDYLSAFFLIKSAHCISLLLLLLLLLLLFENTFGNAKSCSKVSTSM